MKLVFFGTSSFAVPPLQSLVHAGLAPVLVITQPARPAGRGQKLAPSPVATFAHAASLQVAEPEHVSSPEVLRTIQALAPDLFIVVAYGQKLGDELLAQPRIGAYNIHGSLLPLLRGAAPIQRAVMAGFATTGVTILRITARMDAGPIVAQAATPIGRDETAGELHDRLAMLGARLLVETMPALIEGRAVHVEQDEARATRARKLAKDEGHISFAAAAERVACLVRGLTPWPGAYCFHRPASKQPRRLVLRRVTATEGRPSPPGTIIAVAPNLEVACGSGAVVLRELMREGRGALAAAEFLRGYPMQVGEVLT